MLLLQPKYLSFLLILLLAVASGHPALAAQWESIGPYGGHAQKVVIDPSDGNHLYAATKSGQIYQSKDAGERWEPLPFALNSASSLSAFVINPETPTELFVGVARAYTTLLGSGDTPGEAGLYKSMDGGLHWTHVQSTKGWSVLSLAVHPKQTGIVFAGTEEGVFRSEDSGQTWQQISPVKHAHLKAIVSLALDPTNTRTIYAGTPHLPWKTSDGGQTWQQIPQGMHDDSDVFSITINHANPQSVMLGACSGIYRTDSGGTRWIEITGIPERSKRTYQVAQDPVNARIFYAATANGLWKSADGGRIWKQANSYPYIVNSIAIDPKEPLKLYLATDRSGLLKSADGGKTFTAINQGFVNRNIGRLVSSDALYATSVYDGDFGGIFTTYDRGFTWTLSVNQLGLRGKNIVALAISPRNPEHMLVGTYDGLLRSENGGKTWNTVASFPAKEPGDGKIHDVSYSDVDPNLIYVATEHGLSKSTDGGTSWSRDSSGQLNSAVYKLSLHHSDSRLIMLNSSKGVLISRDGGDSWDVVNFGINTAVYDFAFANTVQGEAFAASSRGLLYSKDEGRTWTSIANGLPITRLDQILFVRTKPKEMYVLSRDRNRMWWTVNEGAEWQEVERRGLEGASLLFMNVAGEQPFVVTENHGVFRFGPKGDVAQSGPALPD